MSSHRHGRRPSAVVGIGGHGGISNNGAKKSAENEDDDDDDDEQALPMAYSCTRRPDDSKRKRNATISHGGNLTMKESRDINDVVGVPPKSNIGNDEGEILMLGVF